jgi:hypothetical protein
MFLPYSSFKTLHIFKKQKLAMKRKLRMGMIGGGKDAFIGAIHRIAANMDGQVELVCGALSINPEIAKESGRALFLPEERIYTSYEEMRTHGFCYHCHAQLCPLCACYDGTGQRLSCSN